MSKLDAPPDRQARGDDRAWGDDDESRDTVGGSGGGDRGPGSWGPWAAPGWPPSPPRRRRFPAGAGIAAAIAAVLAIGVAVGTTVLGRHGPATTAAVTSAGASSATDLDRGVVDINTTLGYAGGTAAGTGIVLSGSGEVLTNNHVVAGATSISVTDVGTGRAYTASVVGTDRTDDIAVLQLSGASGLRTAALGSSSGVTVGDAVSAVGNAGGTGGTPSVASGTVTALGQSITASDQADGSSEQLTGLIETNAALQPGDSGGPLVNSSGQVIGIDTAASSGFRFQSGGGQGFAIPINRAAAIATQIESGRSSATVHIGSSAFLGVQVQGTSAGPDGSSSSGALVTGLEPGSPAQQAGLSAGDEIVSLGGRTVDSSSTLTDLMQGYHPGDAVQLGWVDGAGQLHTATVTLATGPAA